MNTQLTTTSVTDIEILDRIKEIESAFSPAEQMIKEKKDEFDSIIQESEKGITEDVAFKARRMRLDFFVKVRTSTDRIAKEKKEFFMIGAKEVDKRRNKIKETAYKMEEMLLNIEKFHERIEQEKKDLLTSQRVNTLARYEFGETEYLNLGEMPEAVWDNFIAGVKSDFEERKEKERLAEIERIKAEEAEKKRQAEIEKENIRLKKEAELREAKIEKERQEAKAKQDAIDEKNRQERLAREAEIDKERQAERERQRIIDEERAEEQRKRDVEIAQERAEAVKKQMELASQAKAERELRLQREAADREKEEQFLRERIAEENRIKQEKKEQEEREKSEKYNRFLLDNNYNEKTMEIRTVGNTVEIWEKKAFITL